MTDFDNDHLTKSLRSLQRARLVLRLKKLWRASSGYPPAEELVAILNRRLREKRAAHSTPPLDAATIPHSRISTIPNKTH